MSPSVAASGDRLSPSRANLDLRAAVHDDLEPAASARAAAATSITPSCIHTALAPTAIASSTFSPAESAELRKMSTMSIGSPIWLSSRQTIFAVDMLAGDRGIDRDDAIALVLEEFHHADSWRGRDCPTRRPCAIVRALAQQFGDVLVIGQRHARSPVAAPMLQRGGCLQLARAVAARARRRRRPPGRRRPPADGPRPTPRAGSPTSGSRPRKAMPSSLAAASAPPLPNGSRRLAAMRAGIARHILDDAEHRHAGLAEQVDRARRVDQRQVLRGRDDHRAVGPRLLDQRQLHVAGAGRQVDEDDFGVAPFALDQLGQRAPRHRPAPRQRLPGGDELPDRQQPHPLRLDRDQFCFSASGRSWAPSRVGCDGP